MRIVTTALLILPVLLLASACAEPLEPDIEPTIEPHVEQLELSVDPIPGEIDTNVSKISGRVSDPGAAVYVNDNRATVIEDGTFFDVIDNRAIVIEDGTFFAYIEIPPRVPTTIEVRAESSTEKASASFTTTFYPRPYIWVDFIDARSEPARMEGWVSYPDAQIHVVIGENLLENTGAIREILQGATEPGQVDIGGKPVDVAAEIQDDGFFTAEFSLSEAEGYFLPRQEVTRYRTVVLASTPRGIAVTSGIFGVIMNEIHPNIPFLDDVPPSFMKVKAEIGKTVLVDLILHFRQPSPRTRSLEIVPDPERGATSENLHVSVEPGSFLAYPGVSYNGTIIIRADDEVPSGSYFFNFNVWGTIEVVVE